MKRSCLGIAWAVFAAYSLMLLSGCEKLAAVGGLPAQMSKNSAEVDLLKRSLADSREEISILRNQVIGMYERIATVEAAQITQATKAPQSSAPAASMDSQGTATLQAAIEACVQIGRATPPPQYSDASLTKNFDAYYNPITGRIQNNVRYQGEMPALYAFNKCIVRKGISVG